MLSPKEIKRIKAWIRRYGHPCNNTSSRWGIDLDDFFKYLKRYQSPISLKELNAIIMKAYPLKKLERTVYKKTFKGKWLR